ncbi:hypothetical protein BMS3Abin05_02223 [bacterium BMS3Abin05]|nr:hypothetical protein BMS3Abin05_02223 [bacterium BMS3Abin05]
MKSKAVMLLILLTWTAHSANAQTRKVYFTKPKITGVSEQQLVPNGYFESENARPEQTGKTDTLRILALRVSFKPDTISETTGNGTFQLVKNDSIIIDPPPHNRAYFQAQLVSLAHYYRSVSKGKLILTGDVYPYGQNDSYRLPHEMAYYNPNTTEAELDQRLSELLKDALTAAGAAGPIPANNYDVILIFHAGVGQDVSLDFDPSPRDIPSAFLNFDHLKKTIGKNDANFQGIPFEGINVKEALILPETEVQSTDVQIGLLGTMALMMGHQLGLPSLYDVKTGRSGIGKWGLMDQGSGNYSGLIPAQPCAWSKVFMGWEKPVELPPGTRVRVAASRAVSAPYIYKIPINSHEYFLIENRIHDFNGDGMAIGKDQYGNRVELDANGQIKAQDSLGVIIQVDDYDFDIPGSGILVWHIDDNIIRRYYSSNTVNGNSEHRGVALMEADGSQDIGQNFGFLSPGSGSELGTMYDPFYKDNEVHLLANHSQTVEFGPYTAPSSKSWNGANTHILLNQFSKIDTVMSFSYTNDTFHSGFPQLVAKPASLIFPPVIFDADRDGTAEIFVTTGDGKLFGWHANGTKLIANTDSLSLETEPGKRRAYAIAQLADVKDNLAAPPLFWWNADRSAYDVFLVGKFGKYWDFSPVDQNGDGEADLRFSGDLNASITASIEIGPVKAQTGGAPEAGTIVLGDSAGKLFFLKKQGDVIQTRETRPQKSSVAGFCRFSKLPITSTAGTDTFAVLFQNGKLLQITSDSNILDSARVSIQGPFFPPVAGYVDREKGLQIAVLSKNGTLIVLTKNGETADGFPVSLGSAPVTRPVLADINGDGKNEILVSTESALFSFNFNGVLTDNFPKIYRTPISKRFARFNQLGVAKTKESTDPFIFIGNTAGQLKAFSRKNSRLFDYPLSGGAGFQSAPAIGILEPGAPAVLAAVSQDGFLYIWNLPGNPISQKNILWSQIGNSPFQTNLQLQTGHAPAILSSELTGPNWAYNYPNPAHDNITTIRYHLNHPAKVSIKILDISGNLVDRFSGPGLGPADNEVRWNLSSIPSGVYLVRVEAEGVHQSAVTFFKIAVVK